MEVGYGKVLRKEVSHGMKDILFPMKIGDTHRQLWMFLYGPHFLFGKCGYMDSLLENQRYVQLLVCTVYNYT